jgi:hypothetical protein
MASVIVNFPFQGDDDRCLVLSNSQWAATGLNPNWRRLRVGIRYCIEDTGSNSSSLRFFLGAMSNPTNDANGQLSNGYFSTNWSLSGKAGIFSYGSSTSYRQVNATKGTVSYSLYLNGRFVQRGIIHSLPGYEYPYFLYGSLSSFGQRRTAIIVDIYKVSAGSQYSFVISAWSPSYAAGSAQSINAQLSQSAFLDAMTAYDPRPVLEGADGGTYYGHAFYPPEPYFESDGGPLNAIHVAWGLASPRLAISEICYAILQ